MTMLDRMRRHKNWLKWSLALVVLAFVLLYIPDFLRGSANGAGLNDAIATVEGRDITVNQFRRAYQRQIQQYRSAYGASMDERLLKQLGIDQRIVQQLVEEEAALAEAKKLGIKATDEEVKQRILAIPAFQENGQFIGYDRYRQMLQMQDPPRPRERVRRTGPAQHRRREAAGGADQLDHRHRRRSRGGLQEAQREGQARRRLAAGRQVPGRR